MIYISCCFGLDQGCSLNDIYHLNEDKGGWRDPNERSEPEWEERDSDHREDNVDEPVGEEGGDPEEDDVGEQVAALRLHLAAPLRRSLGKIMSDKPPPHQAGEQVGERGPGRRAEAHRREGEREREEEAGYYGEENASRYGEGLEEHISAEETPSGLTLGRVHQTANIAAAEEMKMRRMRRMAVLVPSSLLSTIVSSWLAMPLPLSSPSSSPIFSSLPTGSLPCSSAAPSDAAVGWDWIYYRV